MPIYEYVCHACGHQLEILQKIADTPLTTCPKCGKNTLDKIISSTQFQLKGSGWYVTDFKDTGKPKKEKDTSTTEDTSAKSEQESKDKSPPSSSE